MRLSNIDYVKGLLTLLVILGHILQGSTEESFARYAIYSFHMPLFIGISGFLLHGELFTTNQFFYVLKKYQFRVITPWVIAILAYYFLIHEHFTWNALKKSFLVPYYHL